MLINGVNGPLFPAKNVTGVANLKHDVKGSWIITAEHLEPSLDYVNLIPSIPNSIRMKQLCYSLASSPHVYLANVVYPTAGSSKGP